MECSVMELLAICFNSEIANKKIMTKNMIEITLRDKSKVRIVSKNIKK